MIPLSIVFVLHDNASNAIHVALLQIANYLCTYLRSLTHKSGAPDNQSFSTLHLCLTNDEQVLDGHSCITLMACKSGMRATLLMLTSLMANGQAAGKSLGMHY